MIDFQKSEYFLLEPIPPSQMIQDIGRFILENESVVAAFSASRDQLVFTNKRIITANVKGFSGRKVDYTSIPYSKIQLFSIATSGSFDRDCELDIYMSFIGKIRFQIEGDFDIISFSKIISQYVIS